MTHLVPLLLTWALLLLAPGSLSTTDTETSPNPFDPTSPVKLLHPHHPKVVKIGGVKGNITLTHITVPFNEKHLADLKPGFTWHMGFANLKTEIPIECGDVKVPAGNYKLEMRRGKTNKDWSFVLSSQDLLAAKNTLRRAERRGTDEEIEEAKAKLKAVEASLKKSGGDKNITLPTKAFKADDEEHLIFFAINRGWETNSRRTTDPRSDDGVKGSIRVSFGDLHYEFGFKETGTGGKPQQRRGGRRRRR